MGLTLSSTGHSAINDTLSIEKVNPTDKIIALAGNPNVGKSSVFNFLTGMHQHTGNWSGKTVTTAYGKYTYNDNDYILVDLPGTYSLLAHSQEEEVARDFICFSKPDVTVVVCDASCLERNLNLVLQTLEITTNTVLCINLIDEAEKKQIQINYELLSNMLGIPVVATNARSGIGMNELQKAIENLSISSNKSAIKVQYDDEIEYKISEIKKILPPIENINKRWLSIRILENPELFKNILKEKFNIELNPDILDSITNDINNISDRIVTSLITTAEKLAKDTVTLPEKTNQLDRKLDKIFAGKLLGIPIMILLLFFILWLTITGANYPSELLATLLFSFEDKLLLFCQWIHLPQFIYQPLVFGVYHVLAWVVSVMLPPMAIFFPLFTLLEDFGYLPRVAFNLDKYFKKACTCGKQGLTMCMGFGCHAAGIVGCRIIDSPRERLIAMITNSFVPCNGRFPTLISIITMFFIGSNVNFTSSILSTLILTAIIILGILTTFFISWLLSKTLLKGIPSSFTLELPPYRRPQIGKVIIRSIFDRTLFVLGRAIVVAAPAGLIIWLMANIQINDISILSHTADFLDPFAKLIGLDGVILLAFILGFPANEIVIPIIIMTYIANGTLIEFTNLSVLRELLISNGWTPLTAICVILFSLMHWPCSTTCMTIKKESQSIKWTLVSFLIPTICGIVLCFIVTSISHLLGIY